VPIPPFADGGHLPPGRHPATVEDVRADLVQAFPESTTRAAIFAFFQARRAAVSELVDVVAEWLDGSFTSDKRDPADADLVTIVDGPAFDALPRHRQQVVASLVAGTTTEEVWACDAAVVVRYPPDDLAHNRSVVAAGCWAAYHGHDRDGRPTGIVELRGDDHDPVEVGDDALDADGDAPEDLLAANLALFDRALQAFDDPEAEQRPGIRLMGRVLRDKRDELRGKLEAARRVELVIRPAAGPAAPARGVAAVVTAVCDAVEATAQALIAGIEVHAGVLGRATALRLVTGEDGEGGAVVLRAPDPPERRAVPIPEDHESLVAAALAALVEEVPDDLVEVATAEAVPVTLVLRVPGRPESSVSVDPAAARS
jgi:hypothetical protein